MSSIGHIRTFPGTDQGDVPCFDGVSNVMTKDIIPSDGRRRVQGVLNDWDLSKLKKESEKGPSQVHRSGTWQFMSVLLLKYPE